MLSLCFGGESPPSALFEHVLPIHGNFAGIRHLSEAVRAKFRIRIGIFPFTPAFRTLDDERGEPPFCGQPLITNRDPSRGLFRHTTTNDIDI